MSKTRYREATEADGDVTEIVILGKALDPADRQGGMRLNSEMRSDIIEKALAQFDGRKKALLERENALAKESWLSIYGATKLKHAKALGFPFIVECMDYAGNKLPDGVSVQFSFGGKYITLRCHQPLPAYIRDNKHFRVKDDQIADKVMAWVEDCKKLTEELHKITSTLGAMLAKINTYKSLETNWPAGKKFYQHLPKKYPFRHQVPAVLIDELNAALGV